MKFALHFVFLILTVVPALLVFRFGVMKRKQSNFFCFGMNPILLPILHPLLVVAVSKLFVYVAFVSTFDASKFDKPEEAIEELREILAELESPEGTIVRHQGSDLEGKLEWGNDSVIVTDDDDNKVAVAAKDIAKMRADGDYSFMYWVMRLLFSMAVPAAVLVLMKDLYNPKSVGTAFGCAAVSFLLWNFTINL